MLAEETAIVRLAGLFAAGLDGVTGADDGVSVGFVVADGTGVSVGIVVAGSLVVASSCCFVGGVVASTITAVSGVGVGSGRIAERGNAHKQQSISREAKRKRIRERPWRARNWAAHQVEKRRSHSSSLLKIERIVPIINPS